MWRDFSRYGTHYLTRILHQLYRARKSKEKKEARLDERKFGVVMHKIIDEWQAHNEQLAADELQVEKQELEKQKKRKLINSQEASSLEKAKLVAKLEQLRRLRLKRRAWILLIFLEVIVN
jgi:hypothetical protein